RPIPVTPMSMPAIFFTASEDDAARVELNHNLPSDDVVELGGVDTLKLSMLWAIIDGKEWDVDSLDAFKELKATDSEWTHRLPEELTQKIERLKGLELERVAREWSATEEMGCSPAEGKELLMEISVAARRAIQTQRGLFLYTCL
ncbi:MAG: hypothetical protein ABIP85_24430, partial [Chthoniobacteraceae bacterium]